MCQKKTKSHLHHVDVANAINPKNVNQLKSVTSAETMINAKKKRVNANQVNVIIMKKNVLSLKLDLVNNSNRIYYYDTH
tara:strand:- start:18000 stop:18236 length:237 start_codon:yes stop_codon:yes gene_type:complete